MFTLYQPLKRMSGKSVLGFFYRDCGATVQYISFHSSVVSIAKSKVTAATQAEYLEDRQRRYAKAAARAQASQPKP